MAKKSGDNVLVVCRDQTGLVLEVFDTPQLYQAAKTLRNTSVVPPLKKIVLNGVNKSDSFASAGYSNIAGGGGITSVPRDFWERWKAENAKNPLYTNHVVYALNTESKEEAKASLKDYKKERVGTEGIDINDPKVQNQGEVKVTATEAPGV